MAEWPIQVAVNKFSALVAAAIAGEPQRVTRRVRWYPKTRQLAKRESSS